MQSRCHWCDFDGGRGLLRVAFEVVEERPQPCPVRFSPLIPGDRPRTGQGGETGHLAWCVGGVSMAPRGLTVLVQLDVRPDRRPEADSPGSLADLLVYGSIGRYGVIAESRLMFGGHASTLSGQTVAVASKYAPLSRYLASQPDDEPVSLTWMEIEGLVGPLPTSASVRQWWANTAASHQAQNWLGLGRWVIEVRLGHSVVFSPAGEPVTYTPYLPNGSAGGRGRSGGMEPVMDGMTALSAALERAGYGSTLQAVAAHTLFLDPVTVAQSRGEPVFPVIRNPNRRGEFTEVDGRTVMYDDNTTPTLALLWAARRKKGPDVQYNHVFGDPRNPATYTALWNLCVTPAFLAKTTDGSNHPEVLAALRYRVVEIYGCWPAGEERPTEPPGYRDLTWAASPEPLEDLEAELRARLAQAPASPPARAAREIGWLFSVWKPDPDV